MEPKIPFPTEGWEFHGSFSYGSAELYRDIPHVVVNRFPESAKALANEAYRFLKDNGVATARIEEDRHVDGSLHYYVFAERAEFLSCRERLFPNVQISPGRKR